jgi:hypothetical protein
MPEKNEEAPGWLGVERKCFLMQIEPIFQRAVFRGVLLAGLVFLAIGLVLGFFYGLIASH